MRRMLVSLAAAVLLCTAVPASAAAAEGTFRLRVNGAELKGEAQPFWHEGNVMVPLRAIFEAMGYQVTYDTQEQRADLTSPLFPDISVWSGRPLMRMDGTDISLKVPVLERDGRLFVPTYVFAPLQFSLQVDDQTQTLQVWSGLPAEVRRRLAEEIQQAFYRLMMFHIVPPAPPGV